MPWQDGLFESTGLRLAAKLAFDQLVWTPFCYLPVFFGAMAALEGGSWARVRREARERGWGLTDVLKANWKFWIPVLTVSYTVPREFR